MFRLTKIRNRQRSRGQSVVEFALVLPVLVFLLLVTLDAGRLFMSYVTLTNVTRVAANFGSTNPGAFTGTPDTTTYDAVVNRESAGLNCDLQAAGVYTPPIPTYPNGTGLSGISVASMTCKFSMLTPFITAFFGGPLPITASAEFPIRTGAIANISGTTTLPPPGFPQAGFDFTGVSGTIDGIGNVTGVGTVTANVIDTSLNAQTWDWNWGDLSPHWTDGSTPGAHTYATSGTYTVTLTVTNTVGTSSRSRTVTVTAAPVLPVAGFYGTPVGTPPQANGGTASGAAISGSSPLVVSFTNTSTGGTGYSWDFGDTQASTQAQPQNTYTALGVFSVTLTVTAPSGGTPITRTAYVTTGCVVPNFANTLTSAAAATWTNAHFTGAITYQPVGGNNGTKKATPPSPAKNIVSQEGGNGGDFQVPTQQNKNSPWVCGDPINLRYTP